MDDNITEGKNFPNPNVYYEYGLMTSLRKHIIPLQKEGQKLAFNIQSYDTIKYNNSNMSSEMERALRDAVRITDESKVPGNDEEISERSMLRRIEISGLQQVTEEDSEEVNELIYDTQFKAFSKNRDRSFVFLGKIDNEDDMLTCLEDLDIVIYRIEKMIKTASDSLEPLQTRIGLLKEQISNLSTPTRLGEERDKKREIEAIERRLFIFNQREQQFSEVVFGFIVGKDLDSQKQISKITELVSQNKRYLCGFSINGELTIGDINIDFRSHK